jgi:hypothetical protein
LGACQDHSWFDIYSPLNWEYFPRPRTKTERRKAVLQENRRKGQAAEDQFVWEERMRGNEVERTGGGSGSKVRIVNTLTARKGKAVVVDVESSGSAELSPPQRKTHAKKVVVEPLFY